MGVFRILFDSLPATGADITVPDDQAHHLVHVRRLTSGDTVICLDREGIACEGMITITGASQVTVRLTGKCFSIVPPVQITVYPALLPEKKFDWLLQKCTEVGVYACRPVFTEHTIVKLPRKAYRKKLVRWQRICDDAARQCGGMPMQVYEPAPFPDILADTGTLKIIADYGGTSLTELSLTLKQADSTNIALLIGPEGGFSDDETAAAVQAGWRKVSFHHTILRAETAATVCSALLMHSVQG
jgi:16S rRNA (uracil1498-N3)-methyltransferase